MTGNKDTPLKPLANEWPSDEETISAFKNGFGYGQQETLLSGELGRVLGVDRPVTKKGKRNVSTTVEEFVPVSGIDVGKLSVLTEVAGAGDNRLSRIMELPPEAKMEVAKTAIMANRIPLAALGFDPSKVLLDISDRKLNVAGAYSPTKDGIYARPQIVGTILHESLHRGMELLKKARPDLTSRINALDEEMVVRFLMSSQGGDVEGKSGEADKKQRDRGVAMFQNNKEAIALFKELNEAASELVSSRRPMGPR